MSTYRVTGPFPFRGNAPDSTFEADTDERIERAVKRGSISSAETPATTSTPAETAPAETPAAPASTPPTVTSPKPSAPHTGHADGHKKKE
jgi:hypothetical protein